MGLIKLIILAALVLAAVILWRRYKAWQLARGQTTRSADAPEPMVRCSRCRLHLPRTSALQGPSQRWYCCPEHRDEQEHA